MVRAAVQAIIRFSFRVLCRVQVEGWENVPAAGPALLASNHISIFDAPFIFSRLTRPDSTSLIAANYRSNLFIRGLVETADGIWINREETDFRALRAALAYLQAGGLLGIAPEGMRSKTGGLIPAKTGVAYLAHRANCLVIPAAIWGTETIKTDLRRLRRPAIHMRVGAPIHLPPLERGDRSAALQRNTDLLMRHIAALLPEAYRGVYGVD